MYLHYGFYDRTIVWLFVTFIWYNAHVFSHPRHIEKRVSGGHHADPLDYSMMVLVKRKLRDQKNWVGVGYGVYLTNRIVLTVAAVMVRSCGRKPNRYKHRFNGRFFLVYGGVPPGHNMFKAFGSGIQWAKCDLSYPHPDYNYETERNNIGLLRITGRTFKMDDLSNYAVVPRKPPSDKADELGLRPIAYGRCLTFGGSLPGTTIKIFDEVHFIGMAMVALGEQSHCHFNTTLSNSSLLCAGNDFDHDFSPDDPQHHRLLQSTPCGVTEIGAPLICEGDVVGLLQWPDCTRKSWSVYVRLAYYDAKLREMLNEIYTIYPDKRGRESSCRGSYNPPGRFKDSVSKKRIAGEGEKEDNIPEVDYEEGIEEEYEDPDANSTDATPNNGACNSTIGWCTYSSFTLCCLLSSKYNSYIPINCLGI